jgi:HD domain
MTLKIQRIQQGIRALLAFTTPLDLDLAQQYLSPEELNAFQQMSRAEQLHSLNVLRDVLAQSDKTPHALAVVALLHDVGKSRYHLAVWQKTIAVLVKAFIPKLASYLARDETLNFWRAPFTVRKYHPQWSADLLRACQSDDIAIWLAEHHQESADRHIDHPNYHLLCRLQAADDAH